MTFNDDYKHFFGSRIFLEELEIRYSKEEILCPGDEEPQCRYVLKYTLFGRAQMFLFTSQKLVVKNELLYLHPCWYFLDDPRSPCPQYNSSTQCVYEEVLIDRCKHPEDICDWDIQACQCGETEQQDNTPSGCFSSNDRFCVQRIKYFTEQPTGSVGFSDDDVGPKPSDDPSLFCEEPYCNTSCPVGEQYITEIILQSGEPQPPSWYTNPPSITSTTTNINVEWDFCDALGVFAYPSVGAFVDCCDEDRVISIVECSPVSCDSPPTITVALVCENFVFDVSEWIDNENSCRLNSTITYSGQSGACGYLVGNPIGLGPVGEVFSNFPGCYFPYNGLWDRQHPACGPWAGACMFYIPVGDGACPEDCYATVTCGGCQCTCVPTFLFAFYSTNECEWYSYGSWENKQCSHDNFNLTIELTYP